MGNRYKIYLEEILNSDISDKLTGFQKQAIDAMIELLEFCNYWRLCELAKADANDKCMILHVKPGDLVRFARNPRAKKEIVDAITIYTGGKITYNFHEFGVKEQFVDEWYEDEVENYVPVEE